MRYPTIALWNIVCVGVLICNGRDQQIDAKHVEKRGVMDNLNDGLKFAGQMFGINTAADVANLVAKAFSSTTNQKKPDFMSIFQQRQQPPQQQDSQAEKASSEQEDSDNAQDGRRQQETQRYEDLTGEPPAGAPQPAKEALGLDFTSASLITNVLRMIGFDASKLGALAINALIMIAQAIGNTLMATTKTRPIVGSIDHGGGRLFADQQYPPPNGETGPEALHEPPTNDHQPRKLRDGTPIDWLLQSPTNHMNALLADITDRDLSLRLTSMIESLEDERGQGACLKMLMCKSSPLIWGMQRSVNERLEGKAKVRPVAQSAADDTAPPFNARAFFTHLPSIHEYREHGEQCEQRYASDCNTTTLIN